MLVTWKLNSQARKIIEMVVDGLPGENSRRAYGRHLEDFFIWHAGENRPELNKALINRYVKELRRAGLSSSNITKNFQRLVRLLLKPKIII